MEALISFSHEESFAADPVGYWGFTLPFVPGTKSSMNSYWNQLTKFICRCSCWVKKIIILHTHIHTNTYMHAHYFGEVVFSSKNNAYHTFLEVNMTSIPMCVSFSPVLLSFFIFCPCDHLRPNTMVSSHFSSIAPSSLVPCDFSPWSPCATYFVIAQPILSMWTVTFMFLARPYAL